MNRSVKAHGKPKIKQPKMKQAVAQSSAKQPKSGLQWVRIAGLWVLAIAALIYFIFALARPNAHMPDCGCGPNCGCGSDCRCGPLGKPNAENSEISGDNRWCVVLDAGHGGADGGATGAKSGMPEAGLNLEIAHLVREMLTESGVNAVLTREDENALGPNKSADMKARKQIMNNSGADIIVSIHMNKFKDPSVHGPMAFYMKGSEEGKFLAEALIASVCRVAELDTRPANPGDYYVIREGTAPSALVECGFLSNSADEAKLLDEAYRRQLAEAIADGILDYFSNVVERMNALEH